MKNLHILFIIIIPIILISILLQFFLSKNKYLGLIIPSISLIFGIIMPLNLIQHSSSTFGQKIIEFFSVFLFSNILTIILGIIYLAVRSKITKIDKNNLEKMKIKDL